MSFNLLKQIPNFHGTLGQLLELWTEISRVFASNAEMTDKIVLYLVENGDDDEVESFLYDHFCESNEMPYGVAKARTGDPSDWIADKMETLFGEFIKNT